jgi:hypothetical protein
VCDDCYHCDDFANHHDATHPMLCLAIDPAEDGDDNGNGDDNNNHTSDINNASSNISRAASIPPAPESIVSVSVSGGGGNSAPGSMASSPGPASPRTAYSLQLPPLEGEEAESEEGSDRTDMREDAREDSAQGQGYRKGMGAAYTSLASAMLEALLKSDDKFTGMRSGS